MHGFKLFLQKKQFRVKLHEHICLKHSYASKESLTCIKFHCKTPEIVKPDDMESCNIGFETGVFDFSNIYNELLEEAQPNEIFTFYPTEDDYLNNTNEIDNRNLLLRRFSRTCVALAYFVRSSEPMRRKSGNVRQQTRNVHEPLTP